MPLILPPGSLKLEVADLRVHKIKNEMGTSKPEKDPYLRLQEFLRHEHLWIHFPEQEPVSQMAKSVNSSGHRNFVREIVRRCLAPLYPQVPVVPM